jgi:hypothetical protein
MNDLHALGATGSQLDAWIDRGLAIEGGGARGV